MTMRTTNACSYCSNVHMQFFSETTYLRFDLSLTTTSSLGSANREGSGETMCLCRLVSYVALLVPFVIYISRLSSLYCLVCSLQHCDHLLGKGLPLRSLVHNVFLCFAISIWCLESGVVNVLDCIDSRSLSSSLLCM